MTTITINNDYSYLTTNNEKLKDILHEKLKFREKNYFHNRAYKQKKWDGFKKFFLIENGKFLTGLLPEVIAVIKKFNIDYNINDKRKLFDFKYKKIDNQFLNQWLPENIDPINLHDYQVECINQVIKNRRGIIHSPTGSGKTFIMVGIIKSLPPGTPILVLQNRISLAKQNYDEIKRWGIPNCGMLGGGRKEPNIITCATIQSVDKISKLLPKIKCVIVDEIHEMMTTKTKAIYRKLKDCSIRIGLSATPFKFGETDKVQKYFVKGFFGPVLKSSETGVMTTKELQERNILSSSNCTFYPINEPKIPYEVYADAITLAIAESSYFHQTVSRLALKQKGRTLILVERLAHGDALHKLIPNAAWVQGKDDIETRAEVIKKLQNSPDDMIAIATQGIFNTGLNVKLHTLINAASGQAEHQIIQRIGRGLRTAEDKETLNYYDFLFTVNNYLEKHSKKRIRILKEQGHKVIIKDTIDF